MSTIIEDLESTRRKILESYYRPVSRTVVVPPDVWQKRFDLPGDFWRYLGVDPADLPPLVQVAPPVAPDRPKSA